MENDHRIYATRKPEYWGPIYWDFLYLTAMGFPVSLTVEQSREFSNLLKNFYVFLPCSECRNNYKNEISKINLNINNKNDAFEIIIKLHNKVRQRQNKSLYSMDDILSHHFKRSSHDFPTFYFAVLLLLLLICLKIFL